MALRTVIHEWENSPSPTKVSASQGGCCFQESWLRKLLGGLGTLSSVTSCSEDDLNIIESLFLFLGNPYFQVFFHSERGRNLGGRGEEASLQATSSGTR